MTIVYIPIFRPRSWQDTNTPQSTTLVLHPGPGLISLTLQGQLDAAGQIYHRESMKGQTSDVPNLIVVHPGPPVATILNLEANEESYHKESMKGQLPDPPNLLASVFGLTTPPGLPGSVVINPVYTKRAVQDTSATPNLVITLSQVGAQPFVSQVFTDQVKSRNSMSGQASRTTIYLPQPEPFVTAELFTAVFKRKAAQEPYDFPNVIIRGITANPNPFVQSADSPVFRNRSFQTPYDTPNLVAINLKTTSPFVQATFPDLQFKVKPAQEPYLYPNLIALQITPVQAPKPFVQSVYEHLQWRGHKTQEHFDYPNILAITLPIPVPSGFRVMAVQPGTYAGKLMQIGDVFDIAISTDYSDSTVDYGPGSGTMQFGWMMQVPPTTPLYSYDVSQPIPLRPIDDPVPPVRTVY